MVRMEKKEIHWLIALAILILGLIGGAGIACLSGEQPPQAEEYGQLQLSLQYGSSRKYVKIWQNAEGDYYFFLPANLSEEHIKFANLGENQLWIDDILYQRTDAALKKIQCNKAYSMHMRTAEGELDKENLYFVRSENLSAMFIDTESGTLDQIHADKTVHEQAALHLYDENGKQVFGRGIEYIKCRGNSTFSDTDKKSYQIRLYNKKSLLGMPEAEKWVLLANYKDGTFLRNKLIYDFAEKYSDVEGIEGRYVDLFLNGEYAGNYYLCEKVEAADGRIEIQDLSELNEAVNSSYDLENNGQYLSEDGTFKAVEGLANPPDITGGYLVVLDSPGGYEESRSGFITSMGYHYVVVSPETASPEEVAYIQGLFNEFETALCREDGINPDTGKYISEYIDLEIWAQKFLIEEGFQNPDSSMASMYFYKDAEAENPLIISGPVWDYDRAFGAFLPGGYSSMDDPVQMSYHCIYAKEMMQHEEVREIVCRLLEDWFIPYVEQEMTSEIAYWKEYLRASAYMDAVRWPVPTDFYASYDANCEYLTAFMKKRIDFLRQFFLEETEYHTVTFLVVDGTQDMVYTIPHGGYMTVPVPSIASYEGIFAGWRNRDTGVVFDARLPILEDAVYEAQWIPADLVVLNGLAWADMDVQDVDVEGLQAMVNMIREMQEEE